MANRRLVMKNEVADETAAYIVHEVFSRFKINMLDLVQLFNEKRLWNVINDTDVLCVLAHDDSLEDTIEMIGDLINGERD